MKPAALHMSEYSAKVPPACRTQQTGCLVRCFIWSDQILIGCRQLGAARPRGNTRAVLSAMLAGAAALLAIQASLAA